MLEELFGILSVLGDILAPTPATRWFWTVVLLTLVVVIIAAATKSPI